MAFFAPYLLWGALAAGIPIALHFFFRSRYRTVPWAAMKFLLTSVEQTSRRLKFQELLLLALRCALLALLAFALARPHTTVQRGAGQGDAVDAVFVFDTSMSMGAADGAASRMQRAQEQALDILDKLPPHSTVQIITCAGTAQPTLVGPRSPGNLDQARQLLQEITTTNLATDLYPGVAEAAGVLARGQSSNKELYLFSDMQKSGWERRAGGLSQTLQEVHKIATVYLVRCGTRAIKNAAVVGITAQSGVPRPGERVGFAVLVRNTGEEPLEKLSVSLTADGETKAQETQELAKLGPGETRAVTLNARLEKAGPRVLTARLGHDDLPGDNRFDQVIQVRDRVNVLVVDGNLDEREPARSSSYFLLHALLPVKDAARPNYHLQPRVIAPRLASPALLSKQDLCVLVNVALKPTPGARAEPLPADFTADLGRYVRQGGSLVVFAGTNVQPEAYNQLLGKQGVLPLPIKGDFKAEQAKPHLLDRDSFGLPAFWKFREDDYYKDFSKVEVWRGLELDESGQPKRAKKKDALPNEPFQEEDDAAKKKDDDAAKKKDDPVSVVLRYSDGKPAVAARRVGAGEVVLVTTAAEPGVDPKTGNPTWTDWPYRLGMFVPFIDVLTTHLLRGQEQTYNTVAGQALTWYPTDRTPLTYTLLPPEGAPIRLGLPEKVGTRSVVTLADLPRAGVYRLVSSPVRGAEEVEPPESLASRDGGVPLAVVPDLRETEDLSAYTDVQLDERLKFAPVHLTAGEEQSVTAADRLNREWTLWVLGAVLLLLLCEGVLAWWCGRAW